MMSILRKRWTSENNQRFLPEPIKKSSDGDKILRSINAHHCDTSYPIENAMATGNLARPLESAPQDNKPDAIAHPASVRGDILWLYAISITVVHLLALLAFVPLFFSWTGLVLAVGLTPVFGQSITICYHRLLAHRSFKAPKWFERSWVLVSLCCLQDTPAT